MAKIEVIYLNHMGSDLDVVNHARVSFAKRSTALIKADEHLIEYLATGLRRKERKDLIERIVEIGFLKNKGSVDEAEAASIASEIIDEIQGIQKHWSPFSHCMASFQMAVPIFVARQLHRSGIGFAPPIADDFGFSEESRRYIDSEPEFFEPVQWRLKADDVKQGSGGLANNQFELNEALTCSNQVGLGEYRWLLTNGVAPEQARMVLPQSTMTRYNWTGSLYAWANLCRQRLDPHAQQESQETARQIAEEMAKLFPVSWKALVRC